MHIDPPLLSAIAALIGALMGAAASLIAAIYTQRYQDRLQRIAREVMKRETVYAEFITNASRLLLKAQVRDEIKLGGDEQQLIGLRDGGFEAARDVAEGAERHRTPPATTKGGTRRMQDATGVRRWRRRSESNRCIEVLQTSALPLGYAALTVSIDFVRMPRL